MEKPAAFAHVTAAIATPFDADFKVDLDRFTRHARWLLDQGCDGLVLFGTTGEAASLTLDERMAILDALVVAGLPAGRLLVGTGCCAIADTVTLSRHAAGHGAAGALILPPYFFKGLSDDGIVAWYRAVSEECGDARPPIYLYNIPQVTGAPLPAPLVRKLVDALPGIFVGYKDSSGDWENSAAIIASFPELNVFVGSEIMLLRCLRAGGAGCISATANVQPAAIRALFAGWQRTEAEELQAKVAEGRKAVEALGPLVPAVKARLATIHQDSEWRRTRPPLQPVEL